MKFTSSLLIFLTIFTFFGCGDNKKDENQIVNSNLTQKTDTLKINENIIFSTIYEENVTLTRTEDGFMLKGEDKAILINFFTPLCKPCLAQVPHLNILQDKYSDDFKIISILLQSDRHFEDIKKFAQDNHISFSITYDQNNIKFAKEFKEIKSIPYMIMYDKNGNFVTEYQGAIPEEMIEADLKRVI